VLTAYKHDGVKLYVVPLNAAENDLHRFDAVAVKKLATPGAAAGAPEASLARSSPDAPRPATGWSPRLGVNEVRGARLRWAAARRRRPDEIRVVLAVVAVGARSSWRGSGRPGPGRHGATRPALRRTSGARWDAPTDRSVEPLARDPRVRPPARVQARRAPFAYASTLGLGLDNGSRGARGNLEVALTNSPAAAN
jgi:hypothetical protein